MNVLSPDQMPSKPQPNASDSQINGRNPTSALISVALRMNFASPAPSSTPSSAKTIPANGNWATMNHHGTPIASSTERSSVKTLGNTDAPTAKITASTPEARVEKIVTRQATDLACASCPAPRAAPTNDCAAIASESSTSARKFHSCSTTWCAATAAAPNRAATAPAETKHA